MKSFAWVFACFLHLGVTQAAANDKYEVWSIDQSNTAGKTFGGTLYIWDGGELVRDARKAVPEKVDLSGAASALCMAQTGANPVRPHMLTMNASNTHAIISFVASGHVLFLRAATREPVACIRTTVGSTGLRQVHLSFPAPDETYVGLANQNGKLYERINTDYVKETFTLDPAATIDLATCTTPNGYPCESAALRPDTAPVCPFIDSSSTLNFVTLRGGGLFVINGKTTPMRIEAEYDKNTVDGNGCMGALAREKMYIASSGGTSANLYQADLYTFPTRLSLYAAGHGPNLPVRRLVFSEDREGSDSHGAALTKDSDYLWLADRGRNFLWVVDTAIDVVVNRISLVPGLQASAQAAAAERDDEGHVGHPSGDPTPDLLAPSPDGGYMFMSLRGPNPLSGDPHVSTGSTPGVGVIKVTKGGRDGHFESIAHVANIDTAGVERADMHALWVRQKR